jgi:hypothetical protein
MEVSLEDVEAVGEAFPRVAAGAETSTLCPEDDFCFFFLDSTRKAELRACRSVALIFEASRLTNVANRS